MSRERHQTLHRIFDAALLLAADARAAYLQEACAGDTEMRREIEELLALSGDEDGLDLTGIGEQLNRPEPGYQLGASIDEYEILAEIGRGGMGVVYRARQEQPAREVALKILPPDLATERMRRRFEFEAEALGRLQHPGVAQIFAAGIAERDGRQVPFIAMELVHGVPLDRVEPRLVPDLHSRCALLIALCEAVHHAHQNGVIHRDLKPSNVLVDAQGQPKVLDFGVARLADASSEQSLHTMAGEVVGTLAYMSPEQAAGRVDEIDLRADVYALGVLGYQLLSGALPIDLAGESITRALARILDEEPVRLDRRRSSFPGDLATVFQTALAKERSRRYASALALAEDLRRFLAHEPIRARPATTVYLLRKFIRRNRVLATAMLLVLASLSAALVISQTALGRAQAAESAERSAKEDALEREKEARRQAEIKGRVLDFTAEVLRAMDPGRNPMARRMTPLQILEQAAATISTRFGADPAVERAVRASLGNTMRGMGGHAQASVQLRRAVAIAAPPGDPWQQTAVELGLVASLWEMGELDEAFERVQRMRRDAEAAIAAGRPRTGGDGVDALLAIIATQGNVLHQRGDSKGARGCYELVLADAGAADHLSVANACMGLATVLYENRADLARARELLDRALGIYLEHCGPEHVETLQAQAALVGLIVSQDDLEDAERTMNQLLATYDRIVGEGHVGAAQLRNNLAVIYLKTGRVDAAIELFEKIVRGIEERFGEDARPLVEPLSNLAISLFKARGDARRGIGLLERAIAIREAGGGKRDRVLSGFYFDLSKMYAAQGDMERYEATARKSVAIRIEALGPTHRMVLNRRVGLCRALESIRRSIGARDPQRAESLRKEVKEELQAVEPHLEKVLGRNDIAGVLAAEMLFRVYLEEGDLQQAEAQLEAFGRRMVGHAAEARMRQDLERMRKTLEAARRG